MSALYATISSDTQRNPATSRGNKHLSVTAKTFETKVHTHLIRSDGETFLEVVMERADHRVVLFQGVVE